MATTTPTTIPDLAADFGRRADISARSVIVTIFGDSIVPAGGQIWLGGLIELCRPFGYSHRLVRTSMFRLAGEGWFDTERVGRRSRYRLTDRATAEFAEAEARIYHQPEVAWDGQWTVVFLDSGLLDAGTAQALRSSLGWHGYAAVSAGVMAVPRVEPDQVQRLAARAGSPAPLPVATAAFADLAALVEQGWLAGALALDDASARYQELIDRYGWTEGLQPSEVSDADAFCLRTMLIHELRRARLADRDLPAELLPTGWPAPAAMQLAGSAYQALALGSERWLASTTGLVPQPPDRAHDRFADA
jgi:phenylacetic acid degradation operon negative regulatory protein